MLSEWEFEGQNFASHSENEFLFSERRKWITAYFATFIEQHNDTISTTEIGQKNGQVWSMSHISTGICNIGYTVAYANEFLSTCRYEIVIGPVTKCFSG